MSHAIPIDGSHKGDVRLHRNLLNDPIFTDKPAAWLKIWIYIQIAANWCESIFRPHRGEPTIVPAGAFITSLEKLATHTGLDKEHARRCLDYLERTQRVTLRRTHQWTMVNVVNWAAYQHAEEEADHT